MDKNLKDGKYLITLKEGIKPIVDNEGNISFYNDKEYHMIIKRGTCYIEDNAISNGYCYVIPYKNLLEFFNVKPL